MGRAAPGTSKALDNAMKSKGLQKLRWYCQVSSNDQASSTRSGRESDQYVYIHCIQVCEKQCRDGELLCSVSPLVVLSLTDSSTPI